MRGAQAGTDESRRSSAGALALLSVLYFAQGLPFGVQAIALPVYLRASGVSLSSIGFLGVLSLPWLAKPLWAPLVDRYGSERFGRRRSWIAPMQSLLALTALAAAFSSAAQHLPLLLASIFLMNLFAATQDIAVDGLAVDLLRGRDAAPTKLAAALGLGNAAQVVGYKLGMLTGGGLLVWASASIGWRGLFLAMAAMMAAVLLVTLSFREPPARHATERGDLRAVLSALLASVRQPGGAALLLVVGTYKLGESMVDAMFKPFLLDAGFAPADIGLWMGTYGMLASLVGSLAGGALAVRLPLLWAVLAAATVRVLPLAGQWLLSLSQPSAAGVIASTVAENFFGGALTTAMFAFMMSRVDVRIGATHFTVLAAIEVLGKSPAAWASGVLAQRLGYSPLFLMGTLLSLAFLGLCAWLLRTRGGEARP
jgi:MFS family permease